MVKWGESSAKLAAYPSLRVTGAYGYAADLQLRPYLHTYRGQQLS